MNSLRYLLLLVLMQVWGGVIAQTPKVTFDFTTNDWGLPTSKTTGTKSYTNKEGYTITLYGPNKDKQGYNFTNLNGTNCASDGPAGRVLDFPRI